MKARAISAIDTQNTQPVRLYVPLPMFVVFAAVEIRRRTSNSSSRCRNSLNYVERQRKLLVQWRKARNTPKPSNSGSLRPETASRNGAGKKPATKAGQLRALWPEIRAATAEGQSLATIRQWLEEEAGIVVTVQSLGSYLTRIRRKERVTQAAPTPPAAHVHSKAPVSSTRAKIPADAKKTGGFEYPPGPPDESKLI